MRRGTFVLAFLLAGACGVPGAAERPADAAPAIDRTEILWDRFGVPHIFAPDDEELFYAFGWAQAASHADLLLRLFGEARGRAAEYWGEEYLASDRWVRTLGIPARAERWAKAQAPGWAPLLQAFTDGINDYAARHPERIADEVERVLPVTAADVLAHTQRAIHFTFVVYPPALDAGVGRWREGVPGTGGARRGMGDLAAPAAGASNAWAVAPSRAAGGRAMLLANPHLPWEGLFTWYEVQLVGPGVNAYGAALLGMPVLGIAFNDRLGWTHTVNAHDGADLYELELAGEERYRWDGGARPFASRTERLLVRAGDGAMRRDSLRVLESVHGPVVAAEGGRALALRVVGLEEAGIGEQYWDMVRARDLRAFEAAVSRLQMPTFTVMYADADGNILHVFGGRVPVRPAGDWDWEGIVPGDRSATLWTETHAYEELPRVINPPSGWLQNANDPPWTTTVPPVLDPDAYPPYMAPRGMALRPQRSARMLMADSSITFQEMVRYKHSARMELADRIVDDLIAAARVAGTANATRAADVLAGWDRRANAESRGAVLFQEFARQAAGGLFAERWREEEPLATPRGLADPTSAVRALERALERVETRHGAPDVAWGDVHRLRRDGLDLPASGGPGGLGIFRVLEFEEEADGRARAVSGDSWVAAVEFSDPVRARVLVGYGNASQPGSPHRVDQLEYVARGELRPAWRTRAEIEANVGRVEVLERAPYRNDKR